LQQYLEENKKQILREAKEEARQILKDANRLVENTIAEIKSAQADKDKTKELRKELHRATDRHVEKRPQTKTVETSQTDDVFEVGDWVKILDTGAEAQGIEVSKGTNLVLALGALRTVVKRTKVTKLKGKERAKEVRKNKMMSTESVAEFQHEVDDWGMRTDDPLRQLETVLDRAVMIGYPTLKIVHGKGDGILRKFIRDYLRKYNHVSHFEDEHADKGGDGITYAYIQ